jgi:hypothetical protein|nr:MAG TPA: hypothetical protein [Caudoviricetes sp.]
MIKWLLTLALCFSTGVNAREGFKVGADSTKFFTWYGGVALYQDTGKDIHCKLHSKTKSVDQWGDAFKATGFSCGKNLFIVVKEYLDINRVLFIVLNPDQFEKRKTYVADMFLEYKEDEKK